MKRCWSIAGSSIGILRSATSHSVNLCRALARTSGCWLSLHMHTSPNCALCPHRARQPSLTTPERTRTESATHKDLHELLKRDGERALGKRLHLGRDGRPERRFGEAHERVEGLWGTVRSEHETAETEVPLGELVTDERQGQDEVVDQFVYRQQSSISFFALLLSER